MGSVQCGVLFKIVSGMNDAELIRLVQNRASRDTNDICRACLLRSNNNYDEAEMLLKRIYRLSGGGMAPCDTLRWVYRTLVAELLPFVWLRNY